MGIYVMTFGALLRGEKFRVPFQDGVCTKIMAGWYRTPDGMNRPIGSNQRVFVDNGETEREWIEPNGLGEARIVIKGASDV